MCAARVQMSRVNGAEPTDEDMQFAADLAAHYSEMKGERKALVSFTSAKHVTKPKGAPLGAVSMRHEDGTIVGVPEAVADEAKAELVRRGGAS